MYLMRDFLNTRWKPVATVCFVALGVWAMLLALMAQRGAAQEPGPPAEGMRRGTLIVQWTAEKTSKRAGPFPETSSSKETLDGTVAFELQEQALPGGRFASLAGLYTIASSEAYFLPAGAGRVVSATGKGSYSGQGRVEGSCGLTELGIAVRKSAWTEEGSANWDSIGFQTHFRGDTLVDLGVVPKPFAVTRKTTDLCPQPKPPSTKTKEHTIQAGFPAVAEEPEPLWSVQVSRTARDWTDNARYHRRRSGDTGTGLEEEEETKTLTFTLDIEGLAKPGQEPSPPPVVPPPPGPSLRRMSTTAYKQGQVTFTQGGKEAKWLLWKGDLVEVGGALQVKLSYTAEGKGSGEAVLTLAFGKMGDFSSLTSLSVKDGPAGDAKYSARLGKCALRLSQVGPSGVEGSGNCQAGFQGVPITKLAFNASP